MLVLCLHSGSIKICMQGRFQSSNNISSCLIKYFPVLTQTLKVLLCSSLKVSQVYNKIGQYCKTNSLKACCLQHLQIGWKRGYFSSQFDNSVMMLLMQWSLCFYLKIEGLKASFSPPNDSFLAVSCKSTQFPPLPVYTFSVSSRSSIYANTTATWFDLSRICKYDPAHKRTGPEKHADRHCGTLVIWVI